MLASRGKPEWLRIRPPTTEQFVQVRSLVAAKQLHTVCEEAACPNMSACWSNGTATFLAMGSVCTRGCRFCEVQSGAPLPLDPAEPVRLAEAVQDMGLRYAVLTSVDRDDLQDQGAGHLAACIRAVQQHALVEVLVPDFRGELGLVDAVLEAGPAVFAHNIETVERLQGAVRDGRAGYEQSLAVLRHAKERGALTKSSLMVGLGETEQEVLQALQDLRAAGVDIVTIGQYLRPSAWHLPVAAYVTPEQFRAYEAAAKELGFACASGPLVRSSYRAEELAQRAGAQKLPPAYAGDGARGLHLRQNRLLRVLQPAPRQARMHSACSVVNGRADAGSPPILQTTVQQ